MFSKKISALFVLTLAASGCAKEAADDKDSGRVVLDETTPADSTGAKGSVSVAFASTDGTALRLTEGDGVQIGDSILMDTALLNVAKIKLKADASVSDDEKKLAEQEADDESDSASEVEAVGDGSALSGKTEEGGGDREERADKLAAKQSELAAKEQDQLEKESEHDKATKFVGPFIYDAVAGAFESEIPSVEVFDGSYKRIEFQLKRSYDDRMLGDVMYFHGTFTPSEGDPVPFEIAWHVALNFRLAGDGAFKVVAGDDNQLTITLDLSKWFTGIDFAAATVDEDGTIYVNSTSNHAIMKQLHRNIKENCRFGKDKDGDGKLASSEVAGEGQDTTDATVE